MDTKRLATTLHSIAHQLTALALQLGDQDSPVASRVEPVAVRHRWTIAEDKTLRRLALEGRSLADLSAHFGVRERPVQDRLRHVLSKVERAAWQRGRGTNQPIATTSTKAPRTRWTEKEVATLRKLRAQKKTGAEIAQALGRSITSVWQKSCEINKEEA